MGNYRTITRPGRPDYTTTLTTQRPPGDRRTAEEWAREVWESAALPVRILLRIGWRCLGLRGHRAPECVLGWTVAESHPDHVLLTIPSRVMSARNLVQVDAAQVRWTTEVDFERPAARVLWSLAAPIHHRVIPAGLRRAAAT